MGEPPQGWMSGLDVVKLRPTHSDKNPPEKTTTSNCNIVMDCDGFLH